MQVVFTKKTEVTSNKSGSPVKYTIVHGISDSGEGVQLFLNQEQLSEYQITDAVVATPAQLKEIFESCPVVDVEFNQRGRVDSVKV